MRPEERALGSRRAPYPCPHFDSLGLRLAHECDELALVPSHVSGGSARERWLTHQAPTKPPRRHHLDAEFTGPTQKLLGGLAVGFRPGGRRSWGLAGARHRSSR